MIYICIPALDEAQTIGVLLWRIRQVMADFPRDYELLVLNDGSSDETDEVLAPYARVLPLTVLRNERTEGYASALESLIREAVSRSRYPKRDVVVTLQGDFTEAPEDIPRLIKRIEGGADLVGSSTTTQSAEVPRALRWARRGLPWLFRRRALPEAIGDPLSGFRAYRVIVLKRALAEQVAEPLLTRRGWAANASCSWPSRRICAARRAPRSPCVTTAANDPHPLRELAHPEGHLGAGTPHASRERPCCRLPRNRKVSPWPFDVANFWQRAVRPRAARSQPR